MMQFFIFVKTVLLNLTSRFCVGTDSKRIPLPSEFGKLLSLIRRKKVKGENARFHSGGY